jgi:uncharacterized protein YkwD
MTRLGAVCVFALYLSLMLPPTAAQDKEQQPFALTATEMQVVELINQERKKQDLAPLAVSPVLTKVARAHSANMAKHNKLEHVLDDKTPFQRIKAEGYFYNHAGENVAVGMGDFPVPKVVEGWMNSKLHRDNILKPEYTETGLGVFVDEAGNTWYTQVFARPKKS